MSNSLKSLANSNIDLLNRVLEAFVRIYSEPVLQNFLNEQREAHPDVDLPELPQTGRLAIREAIRSPYFCLRGPN
jgi:hypothetical protein